jgi:glycosyltransferase involved in cell wall biosynthesis
MTRLLFVMTDLTVGGAQRVMLHLIQGLLNKGLTADIFLLKGQGEFMGDIPVGSKLFSGPQGRLLFKAPQTITALAKVAKQYDVIIGALELTPSYFAKAAAILSGKPFIGWVHTTIERYLKKSSAAARLVARVFYSRCENLVFVSNGASSSMARFCGRPAGPNWRVIYNGIPSAFFEQTIEPRSFAGKAPVRVIFVGRLESMKRLDVLVDAHVLARGAGAMHELMIVGDGPEMAGLISAKTQLGGKCDITLYGSSKNVIPLLDAADVFVLSSEFEGLPTVIIEAMARGLPIVSTDCESGPAELLNDGAFGILCEVNSAPALSRALHTLVTDPTAREFYAAKSVVRSREFAVARVVQHWEEMIRAAVCA